ncbi:hypothetical protein L218DRAFT_913546, partial [Marasmius fiardii PR-910]
MDSAEISQATSLKELSDAVKRLSDCVEKLSNGSGGVGAQNSTENLLDANANQERTPGSTQASSDPPPQAKDPVESKKPAENTETVPPSTDPPKPTLEKSWEEIDKRLDRIDDDLVAGYKDDIDTLLVFIGLFSAVVTAFIIESSKGLQVDPADSTVALLNSTLTILMGIAQRNSTESPFSSFDPLPHFTPSSSIVRINTFWFLSLTLALVDALIGLLCKQWLRAHQQQTNTRTPGEALALRWLRSRSFEHWHVPKILASLPMILEMALFLFFAGLLELLWNHHPIPFAFSLSVVGIAVVFYLVTAILPGLNIIQQALESPQINYRDPSSYEEGLPHLPKISLICPYRSPQSWLAFQLLSFIFHIPGSKPFMHLVLAKFNQKWKGSSKSEVEWQLATDIYPHSNWPSLNLHAIQSFSRIENCPDFYQLKGFRWLVQQTRDSPSMIPHLQNVL